MSLMQLLTASKSLSGAKEGPNSFRMSEQNLLPRFAAPRQSLQVSAEPVTSPVHAVSTSLFPPTAPVEAEDDPAKREVETRSFPVPPPSPPNPVEGENPSPARKRRGLRSWLGLRPARKESIKQPVQTEWSLERVTVVRNDLSDTDIEIISRRAHGKASRREAETTLFSGPSPAAQVPAGPSAPRYRWVRVVTRFFGPRVRI